MDLNSQSPPSPYDMLAGIVMLPRTAAKARAKAQGTLGEYIYPCPLDQMLLKHLQINAETFSEQTLRAKDDQTLLAWIESNCAADKSAKEAFNNSMRHLKPTAEERADWFDAAQQALGRDDYSTFFEHLDADEGRF